MLSRGMGLSSLTRGERVVTGSALGLLVVSFLPWFGVGGAGRDAWDNVLSALAVLVGLAMAAQILLARFTDVRVPEPPVPWPRIHLVLGVAAVALVVLQFLAGDRVAVRGGDVEFSVELGRRVGLALGLVAAVGLAAGGVIVRQEGET